jgi:hypothetical protein
VVSVLWWHCISWIVWFFYIFNLHFNCFVSIEMNLWTKVSYFSIFFHVFPYSLVYELVLFMGSYNSWCACDVITWWCSWNWLVTFIFTWFANLWVVVLSSPSLSTSEGKGVLSLSFYSHRDGKVCSFSHFCNWSESVWSNTAVSVLLTVIFTLIFLSSLMFRSKYPVSPLLFGLCFSQIYLRLMLDFIFLLFQCRHLSTSPVGQYLTFCVFACTHWWA